MLIGFWSQKEKKGEQMFRYADRILLVFGFS